MLRPLSSIDLHVYIYIYVYILNNFHTNTFQQCCYQWLEGGTVFVSNCSVLTTVVHSIVNNRSVAPPLSIYISGSEQEVSSRRLLPLSLPLSMLGISEIHE